MDDQDETVLIPDRWAQLRRFTSARIALGRAGSSLPTHAHLEFQLAHARARDAVHHALPVESLSAGLGARDLQFELVHSAAPDRPAYLQRPDLGRRLDTPSRAALQAQRARDDAPFDLALVIADGLSAFAIERNALPFLDALLPQLPPRSWRLAPVVIAEQARVALGDDIAQALNARMVAVLIGERPGLSSPDSMGIYLTWQPRPGTTDAQRNCISNIRREGLHLDLAAEKLLWLMTEARRRQLSGVSLKDEAQAPQEHLTAPATNFLLDAPSIP
ncbi:ethanolamine ammonia-lyase subunit EutC [Aromatoleum petrolei]|uniref:Ethanolamine ammonia-lyase small subunit n=1 Tax=Aromatoleum petrolei TaxID=76116 RepID=A0ABX1MMT5_9RHOO|nr:ethanolamine ammonia-lyase subunit EutC [Aromatoleum petrolei]NMF87671.1 ethanolamine ammonia-lyase subunit EutC [Aromatoleum petrolei]QTQ38156.1 Ethanolamine ammonia-lyase light chain [Aromatoleum petrolei]